MLENKVCNDILKVLDKRYVGADICKYVSNDMIEAVDFMQHMKNKQQFELTNIDLKMVLHYKFNYDFACDVDLFKEKYPEYYI